MYISSSYTPLALPSSGAVVIRGCTHHGEQRLRLFLDWESRVRNPRQLCYCYSREMGLGIGVVPPCSGSPATVPPQYPDTNDEDHEGPAAPGRRRRRTVYNVGVSWFLSLYLETD